MHPSSKKTTASVSKKDTQSDNHTDLQYVRMIQRGVSVDTFFAVAQRTGISKEQLAGLLEISLRTINRYLQEGKSLNAKESELLMKLSTLADRGGEIFGTMDEFRAWLTEPAYGLDYQIPFSLLHTSEGVNLVVNEVERIAFGDLA